MSRFPIASKQRLRIAQQAMQAVETLGPTVNQHATILNEHTTALKAVGALVTRGFLGRLKWLAVGR